MRHGSSRLGAHGGVADGRRDGGGAGDVGGLAAHAAALSCPHRRWRDVGAHYECIVCGETLAKGEPITVPVHTWAGQRGGAMLQALGIVTTLAFMLAIVWVLAHLIAGGGTGCGCSQ